MTDQTAKHPGGRPSKYDPAYCERVIMLGKSGWSRAEMADDLDVDRQTLNNWADAHEEFLAALSRADTAAQAWWEREGRDGMKADKFNAAVWKKTVEARFRDDYTERTESVTKHDLSDPLSTLLTAIADRGKRIHDAD